MEKVLRKLTLEFFGAGQHKVSPREFFANENGLLLDVRSQSEVDSVAIPLKAHKNLQCLHIPVHKIPDHIQEIPAEKSIAVFCPAGIRAAVVYAYLLSKGFADVRVLEGGYAALTDELKPGNMLRLLNRRNP